MEKMLVLGFFGVLLLVGVGFGLLLLQIFPPAVVVLIGLWMVLSK